MQVTLIFGQWVYYTEVKDLHSKRSIELTGQSSQSPESTVGGNNINERKGGRELLLSVTNTLPYAKWANRFLQSAIIQGAVITLLTILFISIQLLLSSNINIIQFLSLSFEGPAKWIFLGYIFYMILIVAIATTAVFYNHFEVNMLKSIRGVGSILAWATLIGMNVGGASITLSMVYAGLAGGGIGIVLSGGNISVLKPNTQIMEEFIIPISAFAAIFVIGLIASGLTFHSSVAVHRNQNMFRDKLKQNNNRLFLLREGVFSLAFTSLLLLSPCLFISLSLGHVYAQIEIGSVSSNNYNTFSLYKNTQYNFDIQYPSNWQKIEFTPGIERGGRNTVVNFLSPSEGTVDKFREYLKVEVGDLRPQQGIAMPSP